MNEPENVIRSVQRWASVVVTALPDGADWTVDTSAVQVPDSKRPKVLTEFLGEVETVFERSTWTQGDRRQQTSVTVTAFPRVVESPRAARAAATAIVSLLDQAVGIGMVTPGPPVIYHGGPLSLPLYDYAGIPIEGPNRQGPASPYAHLEVLGHPVRMLPDPDDDRRWTIVMTLRLAWWAAGRSQKSPITGPLVVSVPPLYVP